MERQIHIGTVRVPLADYAVGASAILGIRDSGKTVTSKGIAEQLLDYGIPIVVFDAVGKWRWMKAPREGRGGQGFKVVVAGGRAPDLPLTPQSVTEIVRAALKERIPLIIDLFDKNLSKADWRRIVQTAIHICHYENEGGALHIFLEEAAEFVPQKIYDGETYAEVEKLVRMGGNASVGITLINQRSQEVNKAVLDNCSTALVLGCQVGKNAIEAVEKWIERLDPATADVLTSSLPKLQSGEAWVWTRKSLDRPTLEKMPMCRSFHPDRRTPADVLTAIKPTDTAQFVEKLSESIPKVIEEAKANDPRELKREIAALKRELATRPTAQPTVEKVPILSEKAHHLLMDAARAADGAHRVVSQYEDELCKLVGSIRELTEALEWATARKPAPVVQMQSRSPSLPPRKLHTESSNGELGRCERAILIALAQFPNGRTRNQIAILAGYSVTSGGFANSLSRLRSSGYITRDNPIQITKEGFKTLGEFEPLPTGEDLQRYWLNNLGKCEAAILTVLLGAPLGMSRSEIAHNTQYSETSGGFANALSKLRTLGLITRTDPIRVAGELFE